MVAIVSSSRNLKAKENTLISNIQRVSQSGIPYSVYLWLVSHGHSLLAKWSKIPSMQQIAKTENIASYTTKNINSDQIKISQFKPDIILCTHFNQLVSPEIYSLAKDTSLNIHPSLLPDLKGVDPSFYALLEQYKTTGVSLHHLAEKFDEGMVISNSTHQIEASDSLLSLNIKLFQEGGNLLLNFFDGTNSNHKAVQHDVQARYDSWPKTSEVARFKRKRKLFTIQDMKWLFSKP